MRIRIWLTAASVGAALLVVPVGSFVFSGQAEQGLRSTLPPVPSATAIPPDQLAAVMDERARALLQQTDNDLGASHFVASDESGRPLEADSVGSAATADLWYRSQGHMYQLTLSFVEAEVNDGLADECQSQVLQQYMISCEFATIDGYEVVTKELALEPPTQTDGIPELLAIPLKELANRKDPVWYRRSVEYVQLETGQHSSASDMVPAIGFDNAKDKLVPQARLAALATDPLLKMRGPR